MNKRIIILTAIMLVISNMAGCGREGYIAGTNEASVNKEQIEELQKELDELEKENEQLKEKTAAPGDDNNIETNDSEIKDEQTDDSSSEMSTNDLDDPSTWPDDLIIEFSDQNMEEAVRKQYDIQEADITYGMIKEETELEIPFGEGYGLGQFLDYIAKNPKDYCPKRIDSLKYFTGVEKLSICVNGSNDLSIIEQMPSLKSLDIHSSNPEQLESIKGCKLDTIGLYSYQGDNIDALKEMESLVDVTFHDIQQDIVTNDTELNCSALEGMSNLESLYIRSNRLDLSFLSKLPHLKHLVLDNRFDKSELGYDKDKYIDYHYLEGIDSLEELSIYDNHVDLDFLPTLHNIRTFSLSTEDNDINGLKCLLDVKIKDLDVSWVADDGTDYVYSSDDQMIRALSVGHNMVVLEPTKKNLSIQEFLKML